MTNTVRLVKFPTLISKGVNGFDFLKNNNGLGIDKWTEDILESDHLNRSITKGLKYSPVIIPGSEISENEKGLLRIREKSKSLSLRDPSPELAIIISNEMTEDQFKKTGLLKLVIMHEPIEDAFGVKYLFSIDFDNGKLWLRVVRDNSDMIQIWDKDLGFVFLR